MNYFRQFNQDVTSKNLRTLREKIIQRIFTILDNSAMIAPAQQGFHVENSSPSNRNTNTNRTHSYWKNHIIYQDKTNQS